MSDRLELDVTSVDPYSIYPWLTASLIPRAIAWVSTISADGVANLAPHSFTTVAGINPPTLCFVSVGHKDTLANCRATGEFVVNIGSAAQLAAMNNTATNFPSDVDEFDAGGIVTMASAVVTPPRVAAAPVCFECQVTSEHEIGECVMVFGTIVHLSARTDILAADGLPAAVALDPLARLGRSEWSTLGEISSLRRIPFEEWQTGERSPG